MCSNPLFKRESSSESDKDFFNRRFKRLCDSDFNSDVEFIVGVGDEKVSIKGHKLIFSTASEVFCEMLDKVSVVELVDLGPRGFQAMKQFIYTGEVNFESITQAVSALAASKKFLIPQLDEECMTYIKEEDSSQVLIAYKKYKNQYRGFTETCCEIIETITYAVLQGGSFLFAQSETIDMLLNRESLALSSELELFIFFEKWALNRAKLLNITGDCLESHFNDLKKYIRFLTMSPKEFATRVAKSLLLSQGEKLAIALELIAPGSTSYPDILSPIKKTVISHVLPHGISSRKWGNFME